MQPRLKPAVHPVVQTRRGKSQLLSRAQNHFVREILIGTRNPAKFRRIRDICQTLDLQLTSPSSLGLSIPDVENCDTPEGNAQRKARAWFQLAQKPVFSIDYALRIKGLAEAYQPGVFVRRIGNERDKATDEAILHYYSDIVSRLGGTASGEWISGLALVLSKTIIHSTTALDLASFVAEPSPVVVEGEPLLSLQIEEKSGRYYSEMDSRELCRIQLSRSNAILQFLNQHLHIDKRQTNNFLDVTNT